MKVLCSASTTRICRWICGFFVLASLSAQPAAGGVSTWTTHGPNGGYILALEIDPSNPAVAYTGTNGGGVFKTTDGGTTWRAANSGLVAHGTLVTATTFAFDPRDSNTVYAGTRGGLFKSADGGGTWRSLNVARSGIDEDSSVGGVAIDPVTNDIYAGAGSIFRSRDQGQSWQDIGGPLFHTGAGTPIAGDFVFDPRDHGVIYCGTSVAVFKTTDGGGTWNPIMAGDIRAIVINPASPETLYAATRLGIFKTSDGGASWTLAISGLRFELVPGIPQVPAVNALAIDPNDPAILYAGAATGGMFISTDGADTWAPLNNGIPVVPNSSVNVGIDALAISRSDSATLYAAASHGTGHIFKSTDAGDSWRMASTGVVGTAVTTLAISSETPSAVYAGITFQGGVSKTVNKGTSWNEASNGLSSGASFGLDQMYSVTALAVDRATPSRIYAGTVEKGAFESTDSGESWQPANVGLEAFRTRSIRTLAIDPFDASTIYAGTFAGLFKSTDQAATWHPVAGIPPMATVNAIAIDPVRKGRIYIGTDEGRVYRSDDGDSWMVVLTIPFSLVNALAIDATTSPSTVYAGAGPNGGVFKSTDGGDTWMPTNTGLVAGVLPSGEVIWSIYALAIDPANPDVVYAGTGFGGVFRTTNAGENWTAFNESSDDVFFSGMSVTALAIDPTPPGTVYAGTTWNGVFALSEGTALCIGDCQGTGKVNISALITLVNIARGGAGPSACPNGIPSGATVNIALLIRAVSNAQNGCSG